MKFSHPEMFYLIWAVALLFAVSFYGSYKRKKIMSRFVSSDRSQSIMPESSPGRQRLKSALILMAAVLLVFTLAGPLAGFKWETIEQKGVDLVICLDCSRSMLAADIKPTRLERAKREIMDLLNMMTSDRAGLVAFAGQALVQCPLTLDYRAFHIFLNALDPDFFPVGGTNISAAIETAVNAFDKQVDSDKAVILITDGENTSGEPVKIAQQAAEQGIKVFCVGVGSSDGAPVPDKDGGFKTDSSGTIILSKADDKGLRRIAAAGSGIYVKSVAGDMDLDLIYRDHIARTMERKTLKSSKRKVWENRYQWVLLPCIMLLLTEMLVQRGKKSSFSSSDAVSKPADSQKYSRGDESQTQKRRTGTSFLSLFMIIAGFVAAYPLFFPFSCQASYASSVKKGIESYNENQFKKAEKYFIDAQLKQPDMPEMYYNIGAAAYKTEDYEAAVDNFLKACDTDDISLKQKALYNIGNTNFRLRKLKQAIKAYEQVLENNPDHLKAKENLSFVKKKLEEKQKKQKQQDQNKDKKDQDKDKNKNQDKNKDQTQDTDRNKDREPDSDKDQGKDQNKDNSQKNDSRNQNLKDQNQGDREGKHQNRQNQQDRNGLKDQKTSGPDKRHQDLNPGEPGQTEQSGETEKTGKEEGSQQGRSAGKQNKGDSPGNNNMNQRLLNRLEDAPGKALMPAYGSQTVEKDW
ncbi:MAG: VWA domain-containing protein [Thermodesulfobacteriota bacterium]|nr:VWA domain-containing protein [Thermodesulfobacteriota bacterium]